MQIEIRHIKFYKMLSRETLCFSANVYVDRKRFGEARNSGEGGMSKFELFNWADKAEREKLTEVEDYCRQLPDRIINVPAMYKVEGHQIKVKMDFIEYIDMLISERWDALEEKRLKELELKAFRRKQELL